LAVPSISFTAGTAVVAMGGRGCEVTIALAMSSLIGSELLALNARDLLGRPLSMKRDRSAAAATLRSSQGSRRALQTKALEAIERAISAGVETQGHLNEGERAYSSAVARVGADGVSQPPAVAWFSSRTGKVAGLEGQLRDLKAAGCKKLFSERVSSVAHRDQLKPLLNSSAMATH
jgi:hypothetical protein